MEGALPIIFLAVVLKIPVFFGIWLIWHAVRDEPQPEDLPGPATDEHPFRRWRREPRKPKGPRRGGPHGGGAAAAPGYAAARRARAAAPQPAVAASADERRTRAGTPG